MRGTSGLGAGAGAPVRGKPAKGTPVEEVAVGRAWGDGMRGLVEAYAGRCGACAPDVCAAVVRATGALGWAAGAGSASGLAGARSGVRVNRTFGPSTKAFCQTGVSSRPSIWLAADWSAPSP
ncbi:MAG: hypothetical protein ACRCSX_03985 [Allorhizobium sp.]